MKLDVGMLTHDLKSIPDYARKNSPSGSSFEEAKGSKDESAKSEAKSGSTSGATSGGSSSSSEKQGK